MALSEAVVFRQFYLQNNFQCLPIIIYTSQKISMHSNIDYLLWFSTLLIQEILNWQIFTPTS